MLSPPTIPLAERLRPTSLDDVIGQAHLLGPGKPLRLAFQARRGHSMILWGPPGVGKTTLARLMAPAFDCQFIALSAVFSGVKDIRGAVEQAQTFRESGTHTLLFIDEIHRFNKSQQDALLPYTESGLFTLVGATTENPAFEVNTALLSRTQVYVLHPLTEVELEQLLNRARTFLKPDLIIEETAQQCLVQYADGDGRRLITLLEQCQTAAITQSIHTLNADFISNTLIRNGQRFDKNGDAFYDQISALHKSVRGSNPDAALYWLCRMLAGGADPRYLARRLIRMAWEDIGLADPRAIQIATDAALAYDRLGSPEGELSLAQATLYLAVAAKSDAGYRAFKQAMAFVQQDQSRAVPLHLRNAPTTLAKKQNHGREYRHAHDEPHGYAAGVNYLPENLSPPHWYQPVDRGLEIQIREKLRQLENWDREFRSDHKI